MFVNHISRDAVLVGSGVGLGVRGLNAELETFATPDPGCSNVELSVGEHWLGEVDADVLEGLALGLVNGDREAGAYRELAAAEVEGEEVVGG